LMSAGNPAAGELLTVNATGSTMATFIGFLSGRFGKAIQDKTGLTGKYNFKLTWAPGDNETNALARLVAQGAAPAPSPAGAPSELGASLFTALQEQLGLRLKSAKVSVDAIVIESAERPAEP